MMGCARIDLLIEEKGIKYYCGWYARHVWPDP